jgi:FkbM family methyltransferase
MKLNEIRFVSALPSRVRILLLKYLVKKFFGSKISFSEKEANVLLRVLAKSKGSIQEINPKEIKLNVAVSGVNVVVAARRYPSSDLGILFQVLGKNEYQPVIEILKKNLKSTAELRIIDAGANVGYASLFFKANFPNAKILSIEVDSDNFLQIQRNFALNNFTSLIPVKKALWKRIAHLEIKRDFRDQTECSYYVDEVDRDTGLEGYSLDHFMNQQGWTFVDVLKIDIEGSERYLFESDELADNLLAKTNLLAIEIHDEFNIRSTIYRHLKRNNFQYFDHGDLTIAHRS